ncbi:hypothetical protein BC939DRAFT_193583 [Gamsiella multidivaricata]|uniref:uncharacterized protein n=1 Tax=Gamsiella multidivaricata TaxID=101098 RepID=UPI002220B549|nr:uncharacterized protein BC939DRAFT_193583 [Gamsiella multidivaricata]KAI7822201.1 hypothetical protein BC939DRAFT_193583 [Gamsiella multidivaricata]
MLIASKASEIDDIFSTGTISSSTSKPKSKTDESVGSTSNKDSKKNGSKKDATATGSKSKPVSVLSQKGQEQEQAQARKGNTHEDDVFLGESLDDSEDEEEVDEEQLMFDEEEQNESEEAALAKLMANKKNKAKQDKSANKSGVVSTKPKSGGKVEAVVFNERPAAAAAAAATAKIQKFKRPKGTEPDSDDELEKKAKRRMDDGLRLFDINDLNIGKGGETELCPFDCQCCF